MNTDLFLPFPDHHARSPFRFGFSYRAGSRLLTPKTPTHATPSLSNTIQDTSVFRLSRCRLSHSTEGSRPHAHAGGRRFGTRVACVMRKREREREREPFLRQGQGRQRQRRRRTSNTPRPV